MHIEYDGKAKVVYIHIKDYKSNFLKTTEHNGGTLMLDWNTSMEITGIELLGIDESPSVKSDAIKEQIVKQLMLFDCEISGTSPEAIPAMYALGEGKWFTYADRIMKICGVRDNIE